MRGRKRVCEIGSSQGEGTDLLRSIPRLEITVIDPCLDCDLQSRFSGQAQIDMKKGLSLDVLPTLEEPFDCILLDGDHNWYTVFNELRIISEKNLLRKGGLIFLHDVDWPWGRRDMYYQLDTIPEAYRQNCAEAGIVPGRSEVLCEGGEFSGTMMAVREGGERNGVLTAVEDFIQEDKRRYRFSRVRAGAGLGILQYRGGIQDDFVFIALACKGIIVSIAYRSLIFIRGIVSSGSRRETSADAKLEGKR
jgi:predicted O-methyltransferase YrrM